jgi:transcriptional regulator with XRE-family HTH domain
MGAKARPRPERLAAKLLKIRLALGLSQNEMIRRLGADLTQNRISDYELGTREPPITLVLQYARAANVLMEAIVDDDLDLPERMPCAKRHEGVRRRRH